MVLPAAACDNSEAMSRDQITVEVDVYSGRPNPTWTPVSSDAAQIITIIGKLPKSVPGVRNDNLGYRGMIVRRGGVEWLVFGGKVLQRGSNRWYTDRDRKVERLILHSGKPFLEPSVHDAVLKELDQEKNHSKR